MRRSPGTAHRRGKGRRWCGVLGEALARARAGALAPPARVATLAPPIREVVGRDVVLEGGRRAAGGRRRQGGTERGQRWERRRTVRCRSRGGPEERSCGRGVVDAGGRSRGGYIREREGKIFWMEPLRQ